MPPLKVPPAPQIGARNARAADRVRAELRALRKAAAARLRAGAARTQPGAIRKPR